MELPVRKPIRLIDYDYEQNGYYFVTMCTQNREWMFWYDPEERAGLEPAPTHTDGNYEHYLNETGKIVLQTWNDLPTHNPNIILHNVVIMANHVHGIIEICTPDVGAGSKPARPAALSELIRQFKTFSSRRINQLHNTPGRTIWQRSFHDHIIRNEQDFQRIWNYIVTNPIKWEEDCYYRG